MKVIVKITDGVLTFTEDVTEEIREYFNELQDNTHNPHLEGKTFAQWTRPIKLKLSEIDEGNTKENAHFIFGWIENFEKSNLGKWLQTTIESTIEVINE